VVMRKRSSKQPFLALWVEDATALEAWTAP
jgi:hypothetical protein